MIFEHKIGFSAREISNYYLGDSSQFINAKTYMGVLKVTLPHILAFGLLSMVLLHFLVFTKYKDKRSTKILIYLVYISALTEIFTPLMIILGLEFFSYLKLISLVVFQTTLLYIVWLLFSSVMKK